METPHTSSSSTSSSSHASGPLHEIKVRGGQLVEKVREIIEEGNAKRIVIMKDGKSIMELPLSVGAGGAAAALFMQPMLAAVGALAALLTDVSIAIEPRPPKTPESDLITTSPPPTPPNPDNPSF